MVIGRARTNHRAEIEDQHGILKQMILDISTHYKESSDDIQRIAKEDATSQSYGEYEIYSSVLSNYDFEIWRYESMYFQARQILFCSLFAYYEKMLNRLASIYRIPTTRKDLNDVKSIVGKIKDEYTKRYYDALQLKHEDFVNEFCRLLRNHFMHGMLSDDKKQVQLRNYCEQYDEVKYYTCSEVEIITDSFVSTALEYAYNILISIDDAFMNKIKSATPHELSRNQHSAD